MDSGARNFNADVADPTAYDLVINTARIGLPEAAELIVGRLANLTAKSRES